MKRCQVLVENVKSLSIEGMSVVYNRNNSQLHVCPYLS